MEVIRRARERGQKVYAETCPQYLLLDEGKYDLPGFESAKYVMAPPLRSRADQEALWQALENRELDVVSTDHCSFDYEGQKSMGREDFTEIAGGVPGIENRMELMLEYGSRRGVPLEEILRYTATEPAKIFGMYPQKGTLLEGSDADIILVKKGEPRRITMSTQHQRVDYTPYEGIEVSYRVTDVFVRGKRAIVNGQWILEKPEGKFVECRYL